MINHTPGPWTIRRGEIWSTGETICMVGVVYRTEAWTSGEKVRTEDQANARLVAVAPELLDALRLILPLAKGYAPAGQSKAARRTCDEWVQGAIDIIAKATGTLDPRDAA